jgi:hypothetical protein
MMTMAHMPIMMPMRPISRLARILNVIALVDAKYALHPANDTADRSAYHGTDRSCDMVAFIESVCSASGNALGLYGYRNCKRSNAYDAN